VLPHLRRLIHSQNSNVASGSIRTICDDVDLSTGAHTRGGLAAGHLRPPIRGRNLESRLISTMAVLATEGRRPCLPVQSAPPRPVPAFYVRPPIMPPSVSKSQRPPPRGVMARYTRGGTRDPGACEAKAKAKAARRAGGDLLDAIHGDLDVRHSAIALVPAAGALQNPTLAAPSSHSRSPASLSRCQRAFHPHPHPHWPSPPLSK
jgi:hypothetical protein